MQLGYAVQQLDTQRRPFYAQTFAATPYSLNGLKGARGRAMEWADVHGGVVVPMGILNEREILQELQWMQEDTRKGAR